MIDFEKYDEENPQIWHKFLEFARKTTERGFKHYSAKGIFELIRWHTGVKGNDAFKLNNNYHADYARKAMREFPDEFRDFFRLRELKAPRKNKDHV